MKSILIVGANSFVGTSVRHYLETFPNQYRLQSVGARDGAWRKINFSSFDAVFHTAGIAHSDVRQISSEMRDAYYKVNSELAEAVAKKAKEDGVRQFLFMSSSIVYGEAAPIGEMKIIRADTPCSPSNCYGDSKAQAEKRLSALQSDDFHVVILRCPMIYGKNGKGNFPLLVKIADTLPAFPQIRNQRSMLYVKNLAEFVRLMIENEEAGIFWPCNRERSDTSGLVKYIADCRGRKIFLIPGLTGILKRMSKVNGYVNKAFDF